MIHNYHLQNDDHIPFVVFPDSPKASFIKEGVSSESCVAFTCYVSLDSFFLEQLFCVFLTLMILILLKIIGMIFYEISFNLGLLIFLKIRFNFCILSRNIREEDSMWFFLLLIKWNIMLSCSITGYVHFHHLRGYGSGFSPERYFPLLSFGVWSFINIPHQYFNYIEDI